MADAPATNNNLRGNEGPSASERRLKQLNCAIPDLAEILLSRQSGLASQEVGKALQSLTIPSADQNLRLQALAALLSQSDHSVNDFCNAIGMQSMPVGDEEDLGTLFECCFAWLSLAIDDDVEVVHGGSRLDARILSPPEAKDQLLLHFASSGGGAVDEIRTRFDWESLLGQPLDAVIAELKASGVLVPAEGAKWHILYRKSSEDLVRLCAEHRLSGFGTRDELADRLATIDSSGLVIGYPGELLMCATEARRSLAYRLRRQNSEETEDDTNHGGVIQRSDPFEGRPRVQLDLRKPECPYCSQALSTIPGRKTNCPHCGKPMFVRTRPHDDARVVVTVEEAENIEDCWAIVTAAIDPSFLGLATVQEVQEERRKLNISVCDGDLQRASDDDVKWSLLEKISNRHASANEWGPHRNVQLLRADFLARRCRFADALMYYIFVCVIDLNDSGGGRLYSYSLDQIARISKQLRLERRGVRDLLERCCLERPLQITADECWDYLKGAVWPAPSSLDENKPVPGRPDCVWQVVTLPHRKETISRLRSLLSTGGNE